MYNTDTISERLSGELSNKNLVDVSYKNEVIASFYASFIPHFVTTLQDANVAAGNVDLCLLKNTNPEVQKVSGGKFTQSALWRMRRVFLLYDAMITNKYLVTDVEKQVNSSRDILISLLLSLYFDTGFTTATPSLRRVNASVAISKTFAAFQGYLKNDSIYPNTRQELTSVIFPYIIDNIPVDVSDKYGKLALDANMLMFLDSVCWARWICELHLLVLSAKSNKLDLSLFWFPKEIIDIFSNVKLAELSTLDLKSIYKAVGDYFKVVNETSSYSPRFSNICDSFIEKFDSYNYYGVYRTFWATMCNRGFTTNILQESLG